MGFCANDTLVVGGLAIRFNRAITEDELKTFDKVMASAPAGYTAGQVVDALKACCAPDLVAVKIHGSE